LTLDSIVKMSRIPQRADTHAELHFSPHGLTAETGLTETGLSARIATELATRETPDATQRI
jgi:hypothetical protein